MIALSAAVPVIVLIFVIGIPFAIFFILFALITVKSNGPSPFSLPPSHKLSGCNALYLFGLMPLFSVFYIYYGLLSLVLIPLLLFFYGGCGITYILCAIMTINKNKREAKKRLRLLLQPKQKEI